MKNILLISFILLFAGCSAEQVSDKNDDYPSGWKVFKTYGNYYSYVIPVTMDDGTKCVMVTSNGQGRGISCNWK